MGRGNGPEGHCPTAVAHLLHQTVAGSPGAGVDPQ